MKLEWNIIGMIKCGLSDMIDFIPDHKRSDDIIFIGISPSTKTKPFKTGSFNTLNRWCEMAGIHSWDFYNLIPHKANSFDPKDIDAAELFVKTANKKIVVALGGFVDRMLKRYEISHIKIDHPSPRNRALNNPLRHAQNVEILKEAYDRNH
jgi:hypothetical protein